MSKITECKEKLLQIKKNLSSKKGKKILTKDETLSEIESRRNHSWIRETVRDDLLFDAMMKDLSLGMGIEEFKAKYPTLNNHLFTYVVDNKFTKSDFIYESFVLARALRTNGISAGDEVVICMDKTPEYLYLLGAANLIGAKVNMVCEKFSSDFLVNDILKSKLWHSKLTKEDIATLKEMGITEPTGNKYKAYLASVGLKEEPIPKRIFFYQDIKEHKLASTLKAISDIKTIKVPFKRSMAITDSYDKHIKKYYEEDLGSLPNMTYDELLSTGLNYRGEIENKTTLDDEFTITYSSGTTGKPKGIVHSNRHYITMARYHDHEVSGIPSMEGLITYSNIPSYSNSYFASVISDNFIQNGIVMLDPVDTLEYFKIGLLINNAHMNIATPSSWELLALDYFTNKEQYHNYKVPNAIFNFAVGEELLPGTEKLCNEFIRKIKGGTDLPIKQNISSPIALGRMCTAGGSCETGSIFIRLLRSLYSKMPNRERRDEPIGMSTYNFVDLRVLREDGTYALPYEYGLIVLNSNCTLLRYYNNPEATEAMYITDKYGHRWVNLGVIGYLDEHNNITMKDRYKVLDTGVHEFQIADAIVRDTKNICSCRVVEVDKGEFVAHIIFQPNMRISKTNALLSAKKRVELYCGDINLSFVEHDLNNYYPLTKSLKKDDKALIMSGYDNVIQLEDTKELKLSKK